MKKQVMEWEPGDFLYFGEELNEALPFVKDEYIDRAADELAVKATADWHECTVEYLSYVVNEISRWYIDLDDGVALGLYLGEIKSEGTFRTDVMGVRLGEDDIMASINDEIDRLYEDQPSGPADEAKQRAKQAADRFFSELRLIAEDAKKSRSS